jgi:Family of unknown function (DUF5764)
MEYSGEGVGVYAEAKGEYTRQLCQFLGPALQTFFLNLLEAAKEREPDPKKLLLSFQTLLEGISEWNYDKVQRETQNLSMSSQCDYLEELLTAVFVAHTKVLSAIRLTNKQRKLQITIPKLEHFLHKTLIECARLLWTNTFLFSSSGTSIERQKNMRLIEALITDGILQGVRVMLPVKSILREYLSTEDTDTEAEEDVDDLDEEEEEKEEEEEEEEEKKEEVKKEEVKKEEVKKEEVKEVINNTSPKESIVTVIKQDNPPEPRANTPRSRSNSEFDPSRFDIYSDLAVNEIRESFKPNVSTPEPPVQTPIPQEIPTIFLEEPSHVKFSNVDSVFSDSNIHHTKLSENNNEIDTDMIEFEEL